MLKVENINVGYGLTQVLWNVSMEVNEKEVIALCGPNGAGKSTLVQTVAGLLKPVSGSITYLGKRIDGYPAYEVAKMGISIIFQGRKLFPFLTVQENLELGAYLEKSEERRRETLELVYNVFPILKERKGQQARTLSGGEQQMLAIGRGFMSRPKLMMIDEPSTGLAPTLVDKVMEVVKQLRDEGVTILLVEQHIPKALGVCDRGYILEEGRIALQGTGEELLHDRRILKVYLGK